MTIFQDQLGRSLQLPLPPRRIISLVPSQTELLYDLGLEEEVVGITKFCVHPEKWFRQKTRVGGTKQLHLEKIRALQPDLIIANKEENEAVQVEALAQEFPVWVSDVHNLPDACHMIESIGQLTERITKATAIVSQIQSGFRALETEVVSLLSNHGSPTTAYFIWRQPWMVAGGDTFINAMLQACGLQNLYANRPRYPVIAPEELLTASCRLVFLSSEPYPFAEKHRTELEQLLPQARVLLVDGEMFSWYGSRLLQAHKYFQTLLQQIHL